jgi:hypothetical protein
VKKTLLLIAAAVLALAVSVPTTATAMAPICPPGVTCP